MILTFLACAVGLQQASPTTPIPPSKEKAHHDGANPRSKPLQHKAGAGKPKPFVDNPVGYGPPAKDGDLVEIQFLVSKPHGEQLADSKKRGLPYSFKLGELGNDPLLDMVVKGMRTGGVRTGTVVAKNVYGPAGAPPLIGPNDSVVVKVTLLRRGDK